MVLHDVFGSKGRKGDEPYEYNPSSNNIDKRVFDKISHGGPLPFKRNSESIYSDWGRNSALHKRSESLDGLAKQLGQSIKKR